MPPAELHLRAIERGVVSEGGLLAYGRERAGESALLSAGRRALRAKGGMTVSAQRASGGPTGYPPAGDQPCAARCGRALIGGAPARRCTRLPLCQPRQRAGGAQSRSEETARSQGAAGARRKTEGKWPPHTASGGPLADACGVALRAARDRPLLGALQDDLAQTCACRVGAVTGPAEIAAAAAWGGEDGRA